MQIQNKKPRTKKVQSYKKIDANKLSCGKLNFHLLKHLSQPKD